MSLSYRVLASNSFGMSEPSNIVNVTIPQDPLTSQPYLYEAYPLYNDNSEPIIRLGFDSGQSYGSSVDEIEISRSEDSENWSTLTKMKYDEYSSTYFIDSNVEYSTKYFYRIRVMNAFSTSPWSNTQEVTALDEPPTLTVYVVSGQLAVRLDWKYGNDNGIASNQVFLNKLYRAGHQSVSSDNANEFEWLADLSPLLTTFIDTSIEEGLSYSYKLHTSWSSLYGQGEEAVSNIASAGAAGQITGDDQCSWECMCGDVSVTNNLFDSDRCGPMPDIDYETSTTDSDGENTTVNVTPSVNKTVNKTAGSENGSELAVHSSEACKHAPLGLIVVGLSFLLSFS